MILLKAKLENQKNMSNSKNISSKMYTLLSELFPICRSITGNGVRETLSLLQNHLKNLKIYEVSSGTKCFDWVVPDEWNIQEAYIIGPDGKKLADFSVNNLHVLNYSIPVDKSIELEELQKHLYSLPDQPTAIPYVTSYYDRKWGFCLEHNTRKSLKPGKYHVYINSKIKPGSLTYGELLIPGKSKKEIFLSTYICHPSMANNELSGPVVTCFLANWLLSRKDLKYTYRIIFIPETIGSIVYLSRNLKMLKKNVIAGYNVTCVGDDGVYSFLPSRDGNTLSDILAKHVLHHIHPDYKEYTYLDRGSDERQYCSPGVDLPISSIMRSKYSSYPEYHTSLDNLDFVTPDGLYGSYKTIKYCLECLEKNEILSNTVLCEPHLGSRDLYPTTNAVNVSGAPLVLDLLAYCDGNTSLLEIAIFLDIPMLDLIDLVNQLKENQLLVNSLKS
jgi:aminopeptidase-like protein